MSNGTPSFSSGSDVIHFESRLTYPYSTPVTSVQLKEETNSGGFVVQEAGDESIKLFTLNFKCLRLTDRTLLIDWIENIAKWAKYPFTYTDPFGVDRTVVIWMDSYDFPIEGPNHASGTVILREL